MVEAAGDKIKDGASWLGDKIGDVWITYNIQETSK